MSTLTTHADLPAARILRRLRGFYLNDPMRWTGGEYARDDDGAPIRDGFGLEEGTCWCLMGAMSRVTGVLPDDLHRVTSTRTALDLLQATQPDGIGADHAHQVNDALYRYAGDVVGDERAFQRFQEWLERAYERSLDS